MPYPERGANGETAFEGKPQKTEENDNRAGAPVAGTASTADAASLSSVFLDSVDNLDSLDSLGSGSMAELLTREDFESEQDSEGGDEVRQGLYAPYLVNARKQLGDIHATLPERMPYRHGPSSSEQHWRASIRPRQLLHSLLSRGEAETTAQNPREAQKEQQTEIRGPRFSLARAAAIAVHLKRLSRHARAVLQTRLTKQAVDPAEDVIDSSITASPHALPPTSVDAGKDKGDGDWVIMAHPETGQA